MTPKPVTEPEIRAQLLKLIHSLAPEADLEGIDAQAPLREQVELDSMDFFNLIAQVHRHLGVNIPETDFPKITTLDGLTSYLKARLVQE